MNIDITDIILDLNNLKKVNEQNLKNKKHLSSDDIILAFRGIFENHINENFYQLDEKYKDDNSSNPDKLRLSTSYDFMNDVLAYTQYYFKTLNFSYFLQNGKNILISLNDKVLSPLIYVFHLNNFLSYYSVSAINKISSDINFIENELSELGYADNKIVFKFLYKQVDFSFFIECKNNFHELNIPQDLKQRYYNSLVKSFSTYLIQSLEFDIKDANNDQLVLEIKKSFISNKELFFRNLYLKIAKVLKFSTN